MCAARSALSLCITTGVKTKPTTMYFCSRTLNLGDVMLQKATNHADGGAVDISIDTAYLSSLSSIRYAEIRFYVARFKMERKGKIVQEGNQSSVQLTGSPAHEYLPMHTPKRRVLLIYPLIPRFRHLL